MLRLSKVISSLLMIAVISGCRVESHSDELVLDVYYTPAREEHWGWAAATAMLLSYHNISYSQTEIAYHQYDYFERNNPSLDDISWLLWGLADLDSYVTGTLTLSAIRSHIDRGTPILLQYGDYYSDHILVLYGYDQRGHVYIHEQGYGTRVLHYNDLYYHYFHNTGHYWESTLVLYN